MGLGRRKIRVEDASAWIFNRMADFYEARPAYPEGLIDAVAGLAVGRGARIGDLGAGIGHLALPLADRHFDVVAIEPAQAMLDRLRLGARERGLTLSTLHAAAEALPLPDASLDMVVIADALHFFDRELAAREIARVLAPGGALAIVTCEFADTPFMCAVKKAMEDAAPRRPRPAAPSILQLTAGAKVRLNGERRFDDRVTVDHATLDRILRSISFIGPAMNPTRYAAFQDRVHGLTDKPVWARTFTLRSGTRSRTRQRRSLVRDVR
jgi:ubiquinone/menaquinone biosynthesis C-methylase UbiE